MAGRSKVCNCRQFQRPTSQKCATVVSFSCQKKSAPECVTVVNLDGRNPRDCRQILIAEVFQGVRAAGRYEVREGC